MNLPNSQDIEIKQFEQILDSKLLTNSYKLFWLLGIHKEIVLGNREITFRKIVFRMISSAWYCVTEYKLNLGFSDKLYELIILIQNKYKIPSDTKEKDILKLLENINDLQIESMIKNLSLYVPFRLLTPFYSSELIGKSDSQKNNIITELSNTNPKSIYKINLDENKITINPEWFDYIYFNQVIIEGWINYKLICYLQKRNPNVPAIPFKIYPPAKRDLSKAKKVWTNIQKDIFSTDIYTGKNLTNKNFELYGDISIDHFIPWSFVLHDELWNLIPTFKNVNSAKNNKLPNLDLYFDDFCDYQYATFNAMQKNYKKYKKYLEDYMSINIYPTEINIISKEKFISNLKSSIKPLYQIAENQGYELWHSNIYLQSKDIEIKEKSLILN